MNLRRIKSIAILRFYDLPDTVKTTNHHEKPIGLYSFLTIQADTALINGQRLGEWCGHGHNARTRHSHDQYCLGLYRRKQGYSIGMHAIDSRFKDEDEMAYMRNVMEYKICFLQNNRTVILELPSPRQFFRCFSSAFLRSPCAKAR